MRLHKLQKRTLRIIAGAPYNSHSRQIFQDLRVLKIDQINKSQICEFMFRFANNLLPPAFKDYFPCVSDVAYMLSSLKVKPWASPSLAIAHALRRDTPIQCPRCSRERL